MSRREGRGSSGGTDRPGTLLPDRHKRRLSTGLTGFVALVVVVSGVRGNVSVLLNASLGLAVALAPVAVVRNRDAAAGPMLSLWITLAVFLHVAGAVQLPGFGTLYGDTWWWDHLTHAASASLLAGLGYTLVRAVDEHTDDLVLPEPYTVVLTLVIVVAFGVYWEILEFAVGHVTVGGETALTQYGVDDTVEDLIFDAVGGFLAAAVGFGHLSPVVDSVRRRLDRMAGER